MPQTHNLLEFELKVRNWASASCEGITVVLCGDPFEDHNSIMIRNLLHLLEHRKKFAINYIEAKNEELQKNILDIISHINEDIKKILAL